MTAWQAPAADAITVTPGTLPFGDVNLGFEKDLYLIVKNVSSSNLKITNITFNYGPGAGHDFGYYTECGGTIKPGKTCTITVELDAQDLGAANSTLNVFFNAAGSPVSVSLSGNVINPKAKLGKSSLDFDNVNTGHTSTSSITLTSSGTTPLIVSGLSISGSSTFTESDNCPIGGTGIAPNTSCTINVTFAPTQKHSQSATLKISDNASSSPQTVSLSGQGN